MARLTQGFLIETDVLIASLDNSDPNHGEARELITEKKKLALSPYSLTELDLLVRSGNIKIKDYVIFWRKLEDMLNYYGIIVVKPRPIHYAEASVVRSKYGLTYFDSLHSAVALTEGMTLISYDRRAYENISSLRYFHPREALKEARD